MCPNLGTTVPFLGSGGFQNIGTDVAVPKHSNRCVPILEPPLDSSLRSTLDTLHTTLHSSFARPRHRTVSSSLLRSALHKGLTFKNYEPYSFQLSIVARSRPYCHHCQRCASTGRFGAVLLLWGLQPVGHIGTAGGSKE